MNWLEWIVLAAAVLGVSILWDLVFRDGALSYKARREARSALGRSGVSRRGGGGDARK